nr:uncharacterized mitochondrial protein AtMg00810-like [Tanacetum cinerariifolium]
MVFESCEPVDTPMVEKSKLNEDKEGKAVDPSHYRGMIGTIFAAPTLKLCDLFANLMCSKFKMSMMEKILFFLGLQISQSPRGIFINQSKYALESLKKYGFKSCDPVDTLMVEKSKLDEDKEGKAVDPSQYRGMIGTLIYLTASRPDLQFAICMCARYQDRPTKKHIDEVKRIFRYLRGTVHRGLWYPKDSSVALTAFADADHAGCQDTRWSTSGSVQFLGERLISWSSKRYHFIKEQVENGVTELYFVNTEYQLADLFTKALGRDKIEFLTNKLGMRSFTPETLKKLMNEVDETIATTIEKQVALDEYTLQVVYDVLRISPFFKAFLVTADVPEIYMQEFWAMAYVHQHSIRFKMDTRKNIVDLEAFREMLHISPRIPGQSFAELPFEEEILEFLRFLRHSTQIKTLTDVNINKLFQPWRSFAAVINKCLTGKSSGFDSIRNTKAYKEYYACATGEAVPNPKASARRKRGGSDSFTTPPTPIATPTPITIVVATPRLVDAAKGKQPARATSPTNPSEVERTKAEQLKIVLRRSRQETHISQHGGFSTGEGTGSKLGVPDVPSDDSEEEISWNSSDDEDVDAQDKNKNDNEGKKIDESDDGKDDDDDDNDDEEETAKIDEPKDTESGGDDEETKSDGESEEEETREEEEESFDPVPRTPEDNEDDGNGEEDQGLRISEEERIYEEEEADELYRDVDINQGRGLQVSQDIEDSHMTLTPFHSYGQQESSSTSSFVTSLLNPIVDLGMESIFTTALSFVAPLPSPTSTMTPSIITITTKASQPPIPLTPIPNEQRNLYKALVEAYEADKIILDSYGESAILKRRRKDDDDQEGPSTGSDRGSKRRREGGEHASAITPSEPATRSAGRELAKQANARSSFNKLLDTPLDFSNFIMNWLGVDTLTPKLLAGPTYKLMRGSCNSLTELEYHLEEVYKTTTDQLDWVNPEGQQYPHNLLQPLPLIPDNQGHRVIPFAHFINNDLEYLRGGASSRKYTTSVTKTKAADYRHIKWIEDLVPRTMWIQEPLNNDKHALWGVSHCGQKRQQFYGLIINRESALDVYSKRRIIAVTDLKIVEWHNYKHLDWISVRRDDDKIYKFKEGDFKRLHLQDIEDMLLLLVQGKLSNLTVEERFAFNVSLRMFTRSIVIQRHGREAYTGYSYPRGFIYQNKDKKNRLIRIDELDKFRDGTLNDVCNALDDRLKGLRMQYLPTTIWRKWDKDRAVAIIQAIDKMLKTRRIMRSLERFIGGRQYEGDFRMLQRTI